MGPPEFFLRRGSTADFLGIHWFGGVDGSFSVRLLVEASLSVFPYARLVNAKDTQPPSSRILSGPVEVIENS
jgi:hypothetical protein